jgi:hypothetical protein
MHHITAGSGKIHFGAENQAQINLANDKVICQLWNKKKINQMLE